MATGTDARLVRRVLSGNLEGLEDLSRLRQRLAVIDAALSHLAANASSLRGETLGLVRSADLEVGVDDLAGEFAAASSSLERGAAHARMLRSRIARFL